MTPREIVEAARAHPGNDPIVRTVCLTSGGGDSTVLAHRCVDLYDELVHLDTGTALPGVRDFVVSFAELVGKPLRVVEAGDGYWRLVLGDPAFWPLYELYRLDNEGPDDYRRRIGKFETRELRMAHGYHLAPMGFPGPAGHKFAYQRMKERPLEQMLRDVKSVYGTGRMKQRVMLLSGVRMDESERRKMTGAAQGYHERRGNQVWVNPLLDWTNKQMRDYRRLYELPVSDVTALTHRSGECNCLAFVAKGERDFVISMYPEWYRDKIQPLEFEAERLGLEKYKWGWADSESVLGHEDVGPMCRACEIKTAELIR